jgi:hypothetical protein
MTPGTLAFEEQVVSPFLQTSMLHGSSAEVFPFSFPFLARYLPHVKSLTSISDMLRPSTDILPTKARRSP